jgi:hypothetical protein
LLKEAEHEAKIPVLDTDKDVGAFFFKTVERKNHPLSFNVLKSEMDDEWEKLSRETQQKTARIPSL